MKLISSSCIAIHLLIGLAFVSIQGCDDGNSDPSPSLSISLWRWDLRETMSTAPIGEHFYLVMTVENPSEKVLHFTYSAPQFVFTIAKGDSLLIASDDGAPPDSAVISDSLAPMGFRHWEWLAPTTPMNPSFYLPIGSYQVEGRWSGRGQGIINHVARFTLVITP